MKKHLLIVDDEKHIRELCKDILEDEGYKVSIAEDGKSALQKMDSDYFELFVIDMIMPGMDGLELLKKIKRKQPLAVVIITTGFSSIEGAVKAVHAGAFQYLSKPLNAGELVSTVQKGIAYSEHLYGPLNKAIRSEKISNNVVKTKHLDIIFNNFSIEERDQLLSLSKTMNFNTGEYIVMDNKKLKKFLIIESGNISVWSDDTSVDYLSKGDCWGEEEFLLPSETFTTLKAETPVLITYFIKDEIIEYFNSKDKNLYDIFYQNLTNSVYFKWRKAIQRIVMLKMVSRI
ncbi:MAG: response regulator [Candidatus Cloacimonetes bacterium]|nr:response regulator [Candidatus Cloacimonadota bacterium]